MKNNKSQRNQPRTPNQTPERNDFLTKIPEYRTKTELISRKKVSDDQADSSMSKYSNNSYFLSSNFNTPASNANTPKKFLSAPPKNQSILESPRLIQINEKNASGKYKNTPSPNSTDSIESQNESSVHNLQSQNKDLKESIRKKDEILFQTDQKLRKAIRQSKSRKIKKENAEKELELTKNELLQYKNENDEKDKVIFQLYSDIKSLKESKEIDENKIKRITNLYKQTEMNLGNQIQKLKSENNRLKADNDNIIKTLKKNIASLQSENDSLKIAITEHEANQHSLQEEKEDIKSQSKILQEKYNKLKEKSQFSESESYNEIEELKEQNALLNTRNLELSAQNESLKRQLASPSKQQSSSMQIERLQEALKKKDEEINKLQSEIQALHQTKTSQFNIENDEAENANINKYQSQSHKSPNSSSLIREIRLLKEENQKLNNDFQNQKKLFEMENWNLKKQLQSLNGVSAMNDSLAYQLNELQNENSRMKGNLEHVSTTFQSDPLLLELIERQRENEQNLSKMTGSFNNDFDVSMLNSMTNDSLVKEILKLKSQNEALKKEIDKINTQSMISNSIENNSNSVINGNNKSSKIIQPSDNSFDIKETNSKRSKVNSKSDFIKDNEIDDDDDDEKNSSYSTFDEDSILHSIKKQQKESSSENAQANNDNAKNDGQIKNNSNIESYLEDDSMIKIIQGNEELKQLHEKIYKNSNFSKSPKSLIEDDHQIDQNTDLKEKVEEEEEVISDNDYNNFDVKKDKLLLLNADFDNEEEEEEAKLFSNDNQEEEKLFSNEEEEEQKLLSSKIFNEVEDRLFIGKDFSNIEGKEEEALLDEDINDNNFDIKEEEEEQVDDNNNEDEDKLIDDNDNYDEEKLIDDNEEEEKLIDNDDNEEEGMLDENNLYGEEDHLSSNDILNEKENEEEDNLDFNEAKNEKNIIDDNNYDIDEDEKENEENHFINLNNFEIEEEEDESENYYQERKIENKNGSEILMQNASDDLLRSESDSGANNDDEIDHQIEKKDEEEEEEEDLKEKFIFDNPHHSSSDSHSKHSQNDDGSDHNLDFILRTNINSNEILSEGEVSQNSNSENKDENNSDLNQKLAQACSENEQLKAQNSILHDEINDLQEHLQNLVSIQLQNTLEELDDVQKDSQELRQRSYNLELLQMENSNLKHRVINLEAQNIDLRQIIIDTSTALNNTSSDSKLNSSDIQKSKENPNISNSSIRRSPKKESRSMIKSDEEEMINDDDSNSMGMLKEKTAQMRSVINTIRNASSASSTADEEKDVDIGNESDEENKKNSSDSLSLFDYRTMKRENAELKEIINKFDINVSSGKKKNGNDDEGDEYNAQLIDKVQQLELTNAELVQRIEEISQNESQIVDRYEEENQGLRARITHLENQLSEAVEAEAEAREIAIAAKVEAVEASRLTANSSFSFNSGDQNNKENRSLHLNISPELSSGLSPSQKEEIQSVFEGFKSQISELQQSLSDIQKEKSILESEMNEQMANATATELELKQESENLKIENEVLRKTIYSIQSSYSNQDENDENVFKVDNELDAEEEENSEN